MSARGNSHESPGTPPDEDVKPYQLHISSRYLDLTRQKLELTRLPHESSAPKSHNWWEPKPTVEPLIDYWLEQYSWRAQEAKFNASVPQFRTAISPPSLQAPVRIHFVHARSPHANAVPLLLIPPFPFANLSLSHLIEGLRDPGDAATEQPFHVVIPSLPGIGFSDALPNNTPVIGTTVEMLDILMKRLDYPLYIASNAGPASSSPSKIDWRILSQLAQWHPDSCLGAHMISPPLAPPEMRKAPMEWAKWRIATGLNRPMVEYTKDDLAAWRQTWRQQPKSLEKPEPPFGIVGFGKDAEPNTLAYGLCDSPTGLLVFMLMLLRILGAQKELSQEQLITITETMWLPGPEAMLRFWVYCATHDDSKTTKKLQKPKIGLTVFLGNDGSSDEEAAHDTYLRPRAASEKYACPAWARSQYSTVWLERVRGKPGMLAWERPEVITAGARGLATTILRTDKRMRKSEVPGLALLEQVVVGDGQIGKADMSGTTVQAGQGSTSDISGVPSPHKENSPAHRGSSFTAQSPSGHLLPTTPEDTTPSPMIGHSPTQYGMGHTAQSASGHLLPSTPEGKPPIQPPKTPESKEEEADGGGREGDSSDSSPDTVIAAGPRQLGVPPTP